MGINSGKSVWDWGCVVQGCLHVGVHCVMHNSCDARRKALMISVVGCVYCFLKSLAFMRVRPLDSRSCSNVVMWWSNS